LLYRVADVLDETPAFVVPEESEEEAVFRGRVSKNIEFTIAREDELYVVVSRELNKLVQMTNFDHYDGVKRFQRIMQRSGIDNALRAAGAKNGDSIQVGDLVFDFVD